MTSGSIQSANLSSTLPLPYLYTHSCIKVRGRHAYDRIIMPFHFRFLAWQRKGFLNMYPPVPGKVTARYLFLFSAYYCSGGIWS